MTAEHTAAPEQINLLALADEIEGCSIDLIWLTQAGSVDRKPLSAAKRDVIVAALRAVNSDAPFKQIKRVLEKALEHFFPLYIRQGFRVIDREHYDNLRAAIKTGEKS